jgi:hypothetical protein
MPSPDRHQLFIIDPPAPLPDSPAYVRDFYEVLGRLALTWGRLEQHLDNLERMAINIEAQSAPERQMIVSLERKLDTIKEIYRDWVALKHNYPAVRELMHDIGIIGDDRHLVVHSIFSHFEDGPPPRIVLRHVTHRKGMMTVERGEFDLERLRQFNAKIHQVHERLIPILRDAAECQDPETVRKALGQDPTAGGNSAPIRL